MTVDRQGPTAVPRFDRTDNRSAFNRGLVRDLTGGRARASVRGTAICPAREAILRGMATPAPRCTGMTTL